MRAKAWLAAGIALAVAAGCATPGYPPGQILSGRMAVQVAATAGAQARQVSGSFELRGNAVLGQLDLVSPIGVTLARATWQPGRAELSTNGEPQVFPDLEALATQTFGEPLPLAALFDWLRGRPWSGAPWSPRKAGAGFEQLGWEVQTTEIAEGRLLARRPAPPEVTLRARLDQPTIEAIQ